MPNQLDCHSPLYHPAFGVDEPLNERQYGKPLIATGKLQLVFSGKKAAESPSPAATERFLQNRLLLPNWLFFSSLNSTTYEEWLKKYKNIVSGRGFLSSVLNLI